MSYWNDINKNTVDSAHGACPTMFINTERVYTSNKDGKQYTQYTNSLITIIPETTSDIVSLVAIPSASAPISPNNSYVAYMDIGVIGTGRTYTVYEQELFHSTEPNKKDSKREKRAQYTFNKHINYNGVNYSITNSVILPYSSSGEIFRNGFAYTYWGNQAIAISTKYNGVFRHIAHDVPSSYSVYWSSLPIFDDTIADEQKKGELVYNILYDDWGTELQENPKNTATKWNLYIDGTKNPLYKLTWDCADIPKSDTSRIKVIYCDFVESVNTFVALSTNYYNYNAKSVKLNYHDIHEEIWGDNDGPIKSAVYIIVQFEYFETTTVIPKDTSAYMYCELFPKKTNGHMFGDIGFCKKGEKSSTFIKTDSGDGSTFTAHDGSEGSDGYTKDDDKGYNDNKDKDDDDTDTQVLSSGIGVLTSTFHMTKERLVQLGQFLWGSSIFDEFSLINNNPIENIISCKAIPYAISGTTQEITLGNVKTGVNGEKISQNFSKQTIGSVAIAEHYHNFLDYAPYTNVIIYLPYIGFKELDTSLVMGKTLRIEYTLDVITGGCLAQIYVGKIRLYEFTGNIGVDISITASNRAQVESAYINAGVGVVSSAMSGNVTGAVNSIIGAATSQYHYSGTGNPSPSCVASTNRTCYVVIDRPQYQPLKAFNHTRGRMCCLSKTIGSLKGYTVCDSNIDISGISATDEEKDEIVNILSTGFFA